MLHNGYFYSVEVTDLDSAIGFDGASMIEVRSCYIPDKAKRLSAYQCCGGEENLFSALYALQYEYYDQYNPEQVYQLDENGKLLSMDGKPNVPLSKISFPTSVRP